MVYVIATKDFSIIKIGRSSSFKQRFTNIKSACPYDLFLWLSIRTPAPNELEKYLHNRYSHRNMRGEWFKLDDLELDELLAFFTLTNSHIREVKNALL